MPQWKPVKNYEGLYEVSDNGEVNSVKIAIIKKNGNVLNFEPKSKTKGISNKGYYVVSLYKKNVRKTMLVHRLVAQVFVENKNEHEVVNHLDGNVLNNNACNLEWCTQKQNVHHAIKYGFWRHPDNCNFSVLTESKVMNILKSDKTREELVYQYGVSRETIRRVQKGLTWKNVYEIYKMSN